MIENIIIGKGWKLFGGERTPLIMRAINMRTNWAIWIMEVSEPYGGKAKKFRVDLGKVGTEFEWQRPFSDLNEAIRYVESLME